VHHQRTTRRNRPCGRTPADRVLGLDTEVLLHHRRMLAQVRAHASSGGISGRNQKGDDIGNGGRNHGVAHRAEGAAGDSVVRQVDRIAGEMKLMFPALVTATWQIHGSDYFAGMPKRLGVFRGGQSLIDEVALRFRHKT